MSHRELIEICTAIKDLANLDAAPIREKLKKRADQLIDELSFVPARSTVSVFRLAEHAYETFYRRKQQPAFSSSPQEVQDLWVDVASQIVGVLNGTKSDQIDPRPMPDPNKHLCLSDNEADDVTEIEMLKGIYAALTSIKDPAVFNQVSVEATLKRFATSKNLKLGKISTPLRKILRAPPADNIFHAIQIFGKNETLARLDEAIKNGW